MAKFFGFEITRSNKKKGTAFSPPENDDGAIPLAPGGHMGAYLNMDGTIKNEIELITKYRELALQAEVDAAVDDIVNEAIVISDERESVVNLELKNLGAPEIIKEKIYDEYLEELTDYADAGADIFLFETFNSTPEAEVAIKAAKEINIPAWVAFVPYKDAAF